MKRKEFLNWAGIGLLASFFPIALAACSEKQSDELSETVTTAPIAADVPDAEGYLTLGTAQELTENGYLINSKSNVIVFRNSSNNLSAFSLICTHQGCTVDWKKSSNILYCPCHGSEFTSDGKVVNGPAPSPLPSFEIKEENESILVKVG